MRDQKHEALFVYQRVENLENPAYLRLLKMKRLVGSVFSTVNSINIWNQPLSKIQRLTFSHKLRGILKRRLKEACEGKENIVIFASTMNLAAMLALRKFCIKKKYKLVYDVVEWASPSEKRLGVFSPSLLKNRYMDKYYPRKGLVTISISKFIYDFYKRKNVPSIIIPNMVESDKIKYIEPVNDDFVNFVFVGYPHKKDALDCIVEAFLGLDKTHAAKCKFHVVGTSESDFFQAYPRLVGFKKQIAANVAFYGKVSHATALDLYKKSDYSIIFRNPDLDVCKAGFPTKFVESLSQSRPVITNSYSDVADYLVEGQNGYLVPTFKVSELANTISKAIDLHSERGELMKRAAYASSIEFFDFKNYSEKLAVFLGVENV